MTRTDGPVFHSFINHDCSGISQDADPSASNHLRLHSGHDLGQEPVAISLSGRVPATARAASAGVAAGVGRDGLPRTILKAKVESLSLPHTLTVIVTTAKKN